MKLLDQARKEINKKQKRVKDLQKELNDQKIIENFILTNSIILNSKILTRSN